MKRRVFLIVLDSFGIGYEPDADDFGDRGANTLKTIMQSEQFRVPTMESLGLFAIDGTPEGEVPEKLLGSYGRLQEQSRGKDTTVGHWEIAGLISERPLPVYPDGFPEGVIREFEEKTGRKVLCNKPYSGTEVIARYGEEHLKTGALIVYTSADSVFQIAAHEDLVPPEQLYEYCRIAREILQGEHGVGRVIARPFTGTPGNFVRTPRRHDFSLVPPQDTMLDLLQRHGLRTISIGKINDIFAGKGIDESHPTKGNGDDSNRCEKYLSFSTRAIRPKGMETAWRRRWRLQGESLKGSVLPIWWILTCCMATGMTLTAMRLQRRNLTAGCRDSWNRCEAGIS